MFDMFGIEFDGHPDLSRILMPEDWIGHPLRKDYEIGEIPVQFKGAPRMTHRPMTHPGTTRARQEMRPRSQVPAARADARGRRRAAHERGRGGQRSGDLPDDPDEDQTMIINMGPQHPSTHGVLRLMLELQGETVLRCKPIIGYLHTGMEKTGEQLTFMQGGTNVTRMDYVSPIANELVFSMATEKLLGIDGDIPERAVWMRMLLAELNRMASHLLFLATNGMDLGAVSMMIYGWREREEVLRFFQKVTGLRMNHNFIRPGGVAADLPPGWRDDVLRLLDLIPERLDEYDMLMTGQPIWRERLQGVGVITPAGGARARRHRSDPALDRRRLGPPPRHALPALRRGRVRRDRRHVRRRVRPLRDPPQRDPRVDADRAPDPRSHAAGRLPDPGQEGHAAAAGAHRRIDGGADPPLQDLHRGLQGARGRGLRRDREPAWRDRVLHRQRWLGHAVPHARARHRRSSTSSACRT